MKEYMFKKFSEIENSYQRDFITKISNEYADNCDWLVFEKVDGSNFSFIYGYPHCFPDNLRRFSSQGKWGEKECLLHAKRTSIITEPKSFFDYSNVAQKYNDKIHQTFLLFKELYPELLCINVFGELYGGFYPDIQSKSKPINKNIFYSPDIEFIVFDVFIQHFQGGFWSNYDEYSNILEQVGIPYLKPLFKGSFKDALEYPNKFITTIPKLHDLREVDNNFAEGVVIKPIKNMQFKNGSRILVKNKNDKFSEKIIKNTKTDSIATKFSTVEDYITENRLNNVVSKMGILTFKDFSILMKEFCNDVIKDYTKDCNQSITDKEMKELHKIVSNCAKPLVRNFLKK